MRRIMLLLMMLALSGSTVWADSADEIAAIKQTARNYMEAWYQGDAKRMKASLHKKLAKRSLQETHAARKDLRLTSASDMVAYTRGGYGERLWTEGSQIEVVVLDCFQNIASVKVITPHYYEYLHLAKTGPNWVIINALYEKNATAKN